jgi:FKBP-type peptidyl-prolyl cis-trans isomerase SlyD
MVSVQEHDFIELEYTGKLLDGMVFDTTNEKVAKENDAFSEKAEYKPAIVCIGEKQLLPGLDEQLAGKEIEKAYTVTLQPDEAFGKRDVKKMKIVPMSTFKQHNVQPQPGLQIDVDGEMGTVRRVAGGRVIVNFNHPLAGKEVQYEFTILRKITDVREQICAFVGATFRIPSEKLQVDVVEKKATVTLPLQLPQQITDIIGKKLEELVDVTEISFVQPTAK